MGQHMIKALEELFHTYKVNIHLSGHYHRYKLGRYVKNILRSDNCSLLYVVKHELQSELRSNNILMYYWWRDASQWFLRSKNLSLCYSEIALRTFLAQFDNRYKFMST